MLPNPNTTSTKKKPHRPRAAKLEAQNAHFALVSDAAQTVTEILKSHGISCAVFGSLASKLYGSSRCPKDVDILVSQDRHSEPDSDSLDSDSSDSNHDLGKQKPLALSAHELKHLILRANSRNFYLKMPRDPQAEYRILWYRQRYLGPECKVDILVPGTMHLPSLSRRSERDSGVLFIESIPVVPFSLLLLHKLQGWDDHRNAEEPHNSRKQHQDAADVRRLMALRHLVEALQKTKPWDDEELFSEEFMGLTRERVKAYCKVFPDRAEDWRQLAFDVV